MTPGTGNKRIKKAVPFLTKSKPVAAVPPTSGRRTYRKSMKVQMPKPLYNHSILDHPMQCTCGWYGIIGDCLFDIDDDGGIGCPLCSKIVSEQHNPRKQAIVAGGVRAMGEKELKGCPVCGSQIATIRGKYPSEPKRQVCPTCLKERMDVIHDMSDPVYGWLVVQNRQ